MRPVRVEMTAFGPYADRQVVDFRELGENRLFLIHGQTGAGKTSILDAISFALYGETSGAERQAAQMRSHHAPDGLATEVVLDFALGGEQWRVRRRPGQRRPARRGSGMTEVPADAALYRRGADAGDREDGAPVATRVREVDEQVRALLGFSAAEFRQVVVLPQGRFRELLVADTKDREKILEALFRTAFYGRMEEALKARAAESRREAERLRDRATTLLDHAGVPEEGGTAARIGAVGGRIAALMQVDACLAERVAAAEEAEAQAQQALEAGRRTAETLRRRDEAAERLAAAKAQEPEREAAEAECKAARRAARIRPAVDAAIRAEARAAEQARRDAEAAEALSAAEAEAQRTAAALEAEVERAPERDAAEQAFHRWQGLVEVAEKVAKATEARDAAAAARDEAEEQVKTATQAGTDARQRVEALDSALKADRQVAADREAAGLAVEAARQVARLAADRDRLCRDRDGVRAERSAAADTADRTTERAKAVRAEAAALESRFWAGEAAALAATLARGKFCLVWGGREHLAPAAGGDGAVDRAALAQARDVADTAETARQEAVLALERLDGRLRSLDAQIGTRTEDLGSAAERPLADLAVAVAEAEARRDAAEAASKRVETGERQLAEAKAAVDAADAALKHAQERHATAERNHATEQATLDGLVARLPEDARTPEAVSARLSEATNRRDGLRMALETAQQAARTADRALAMAAAEAKAAKTARADADAEAVRTLEERTAALAAQGFADLEAWRIAERSDEAIAVLEKRIKAIGEALATARDALDQAEAAADGLAPPDLVALEAAWQNARTRRADVAEAQARLGERIGYLARQWRELLAVETDWRAAEARHEMDGELARVATGKNDLNLSFQNFVQATLLDEVVEQANRRLERMSRGRYVLRRAGGVTDKRRAAGLDLDVWDAHTDRVRSVRTLSGGEGFLAALSLALGVVDVVQAHAGGIAIEAMFVDEGFGSLDSEALDAAIQALVDLRSAGRLVGVISHVGELKERLPARLEVVAGRTGSAVRFDVSGA